MLAHSTKYALRALLYLCEEKLDTFIQVKILARRIRVPAPYLSKVVKTLTNEGFLAARRGKSGGVLLGPKINTASFYDVCISMNDPITKSSCLLSHKPCRRNHPCPFHSDWGKTKETMLNFLNQARFM